MKKALLIFFGPSKFIIATEYGSSVPFVISKTSSEIVCCENRKNINIAFFMMD